jgi:hypothetical protein
VLAQHTTRNAVKIFIRASTMATRSTSSQPAKSSIFLNAAAGTHFDRNNIPAISGTGQNGTKIRRMWGDLLPRRGYRIQPRVSTLGTAHRATRPERAPDQRYKKQTRRTYLSRARNRSALCWCALFYRAGDCISA